MPCTFDSDRAEIDSEDVERRLRAAVDRRSSAADERVRSELLDDVRGQRQRSASGKSPQDHQWENLRRKTRGAEHRTQRIGEHVHCTRGAKHADGHENPDQKRDDANRDLESFLGTFDEDVVDLQPADHSHKRNSDEQYGNGPQRDCSESRANHSAASSCGALSSSYGKNRCRIFAVVTAAIAPQNVAMIVVEMIAVGFFDPAATSTPMIVAGMN